MASNQSKEAKNTVSQKWSHFPMVLEGILKDFRFRPNHGRPQHMNREFSGDVYFRRRTA